MSLTIPVISSIIDVWHVPTYISGLLGHIGYYSRAETGSKKPIGNRFLIFTVSKDSCEQNLSWNLGFSWIVCKKTNKWYIEWQRVTTSDSEWYKKRQRMTTSSTASDNEWHSEWQRMTTSENEWQRVIILAKLLFKEEPWEEFLSTL